MYNPVKNVVLGEVLWETFNMYLHFPSLTHLSPSTKIKPGKVLTSTYNIA